MSRENAVWRRMLAAADDRDNGGRCPCKSGSVRDPWIHNRQVRDQGRCSCPCHDRSTR